MSWAIGIDYIAQPSHSFPSLAFYTSPSAVDGHQKLTNCYSIFVHARETAGRQALIPGSQVSFIYEADEQGGKAKEVIVVELTEATVLEEGPRETGAVKVRLTGLPSLSLRLTQTRGFYAIIMPWRGKG